MTENPIYALADKITSLVRLKRHEKLNPIEKRGAIADAYLSEIDWDDDDDVQSALEEIINEIFSCGQTNGIEIPEARKVLCQYLGADLE